MDFVDVIQMSTHNVLKKKSEEKKSQKHHQNKSFADLF